MRRFVLIIALLLAAACVGADSVAVLDAFLDDSVDSTAGVPITEKIIEEFVSSGDFTVIDRGNITSLLEEMEFYLSGLVKDSEAKRAGEYIGADIVCVTKVSRVGSTYFVSGKLIDVETGEIIAQKSQEKAGTIEVVLELAHMVGKALAGGESDNSTTAQETAKTPEEPVKAADPPKDSANEQTAPTNQPTRPTESPAEIATDLPVSYVSMAFFTGQYSGELYEQIENALSIVHFGYEASNMGLDVRYLNPFSKIMYSSIGFSIGVSLVDVDGDGRELHFLSPALRTGAGVIWRLARFVQIFGGAGVSLRLLSPGDIWIGDDTELFGFGYFIEAGADFIAGGLIVNGSVTFAGSDIGDVSADIDNRPFNHIGFTIGAALPF